LPGRPCRYMSRQAATVQTVPNSVQQITRSSAPLPYLVPRSAARLRCFDGQPQIPVLPATRLQLVLLLDQPSLDLRAIGEVVLSDVGAALQAFRGARSLPGNRFRRINSLEECIVLLGRAKLRNVLALKPNAESARAARAIRPLAARARLTAELAGTIARRFREIDPTSAYLAGLLHEIGRIPALLNWKVAGADLKDIVSVGSLLASEWGLPDFVEPTLQFTDCRVQPWAKLRRIVSIAWDMANAISGGATAPQRVLSAHSRARERSAQARQSFPLRPIRIQ